MKFISTTSLLVLIAAPALAQSQFEKELALLTAQRDKAIEAAAAPIEKKYQEALEVMLKKAMQASDLDGALKIREALGQVASDDPFRDDIESRIEGTRWLWPIKFAANTAESIRWISFEKNNVVKHGWYGLSASWRPLKPNSIELTQEGTVDFVWIIEFNNDFTKGTVIQKSGREREPLRLIDKETGKAK
jgi:hypothetical protein